MDLGGSHIGCGIVERGSLLASSSFVSDSRSLRAILPIAKQHFLALSRQTGIPFSACRGLGVGFPAVIDSEHDEILSTLGTKFADMSGPDLCCWSRQELGLPARLENDAKLALLGEHHAGAATGFEDVVMVTLGTGIGVAAMLQNRLLRSRMGQAGLLGGHLSIHLHGRTCVCGAIGCAEAEASTSILPDLLRGWPGGANSALAQAVPLDFAALFRSHDLGDDVAGQILEHCLRVWSVLTVNLIHAYGPQLILFGGGVMHRGGEVLPVIRSYVEQHCWRTTRGLAAIEPGRLGTSAALIGAEALFPPEAP